MPGPVIISVFVSVFPPNHFKKLLESEVRVSFLFELQKIAFNFFVSYFFVTRSGNTDAIKARFQSGDG